jgi:NAD(P)H-dependent FMN reductase
MKILCIQGSLNPDSNTDTLLRAAFDRLEGVKKAFLDLREVKLEFCDGRDLSKYHEDLQVAAKEVEQSDAYIIGMPVYCYSVSGALKNFLDITCSGMENKPFAIVCAAGGERSYLATADLQKILLFEVRCRPFPRVVFATGKDFKDGKVANGEVDKRLDQLTKEFVAWAKLHVLEGAS